MRKPTAPTGHFVPRRRQNVAPLRLLASAWMTAPRPCVRRPRLLRRTRPFAGMRVNGDDVISLCQLAMRRQIFPHGMVNRRQRLSCTLSGAAGSVRGQPSPSGPGCIRTSSHLGSGSSGECSGSTPRGIGKAWIGIDAYRREATAAGSRLSTFRSRSPQLSPMRRLAGNSRSFRMAPACSSSRTTSTAAAPMAYPGCST